jgi:phage shock protein E
MKPRLLAASIVAALTLARIAAAESLGDVKAAVEKGSAVLVDVRSESEWNTGHLRLARWLPITSLEAKPSLADDLPKGKPIYLHCAAGPRARKAAALLKERGLDARPLSVRYAELVEAGFEQAPKAGGAH